MEEIWKDVEGYEGLYQISNFGRVKSLQRYIKHARYKIMCIKEKILKPQLNTSGYLGILLYKNNKAKKYQIHRLIGEVFIENLNCYPQINHKDGNKLNNLIENLEWCTCSQNHTHAFKLGLKDYKGEKGPNAKLTNDQVGEIRQLLQNTNMSQRKIAALYDISSFAIFSIKHYKSWKN